MKKPRRRSPPGLDDETSVRGTLLASREGPLRAEHHGEDAIVLGGVDASRTRTLRFGERDQLTVERRLDARIEHVNRKTEASNRVPVVDHAYGPEVEARIAGNSRRNLDALGGTAIARTEQAAGDDRVAIPDLSVGPVPCGRHVRQPEVLPARARRPGSRQLKLTPIDVDPIRDHAERNLVVAAEQAGAAQVAAAGLGGRADTVVEVTAEGIAGAKPGRFDVDAREHRPAPLVIRIVALRGPRLRASGTTRARNTGSSGVVGRIDLVEDRRHA